MECGNDGKYVAVFFFAGGGGVYVALIEKLPHTPLELSRSTRISQKLLSVAITGWIYIKGTG